VVKISRIVYAFSLLWYNSDLLAKSNGQHTLLQLLLSTKW
jgi:hypothetical protein